MRSYSVEFDVSTSEKHGRLALLRIGRKEKEDQLKSSMFVRFAPFMLSEESYLAKRYDSFFIIFSSDWTSWKHYSAMARLGAETKLTQSFTMMYETVQELYPLDVRWCNVKKRTEILQGAKREKHYLLGADLDLVAFELLKPII